MPAGHAPIGCAQFSQRIKQLTAMTADVAMRGGVCVATRSESNLRRNAQSARNAAAARKGLRYDDARGYARAAAIVGMLRSGRFVVHQRRASC